MVSRTVHVLPGKNNGDWIVTKSGRAPATFATRKEATAAAKRLVKGKIGQVVLLTRGGRIITVVSHGLPKIPRPAFRSKIGRRVIEKAVATVLKARLTPA